MQSVQSCKDFLKAHSQGRGAFSREGKLIRFVSACWREKTGDLFATESGVQCSSCSLWLQGCRVGGLETSCQSCCLQASDCRAGMKACNFKSISVHVPAMIFTPQRLRVHNRFLFEDLPLDLVPNYQPCCGDHISVRLVGINLDSLEISGNLSSLIWQNMNIFAYFSFVKLQQYKNSSSNKLCRAERHKVFNQYIRIKTRVEKLELTHLPRLYTLIIL